MGYNIWLLLIQQNIFWQHILFVFLVLFFTPCPSIYENRRNLQVMNAISAWWFYMVLANNEMKLGM